MSGGMAIRFSFPLTKVSTMATSKLFTVHFQQGVWLTYSQIIVQTLSKTWDKLYGLHKVLRLASGLARLST